MLKNDLLTRIMLKVSSAAESRLDGCPLPTMSSSGAGTKGLVVILPVSEAADVLGVSMEKKVRALAIAHLVNRYINAYIGKLSPMCSCVMASSTAASVGIAYLLGGSDEQLGYAVRNMSGTVTGMICDGGKVGCAMKVATGSSAALLCALTAVHDAPLRVSDGICAETPEDCIRHMAQLLNSIMGTADTMMVSNIGSAAISAVSLVDSINILVIQAFSALAAGGAIVCSQYIGQQNKKMANESARQVLFIITAISIAVSVLCLGFKKPLLRLIFGSVEADVMRASEIRRVQCSFP